MLDRVADYVIEPDVAHEMPVPEVDICQYYNMLGSLQASLVVPLTSVLAPSSAAEVRIADPFLEIASSQFCALSQPAESSQRMSVWNEQLARRLEQACSRGTCITIHLALLPSQLSHAILLLCQR